MKYECPCLWHSGPGFSVGQLVRKLAPASGVQLPRFCRHEAAVKQHPSLESTNVGAKVVKA